MKLIPNRKKIVLTPVKNEAWILPTFLKATSLWADYIIIADQDSNDGSIDIYKQYSKVVCIHNDSKDLDEGYRDKLMLQKARELAGTNTILFRLDADEIFTPNFNSKGWNELLSSPPGSVWFFRMGNVGKNFSGYSIANNVYGAFVDDGRIYNNQGLMHVRMMFTHNDGSKPFLLEDMILLHLQFVDWKRMESKHRWYQCFEHINFPNEHCIDIFRKYHWMYNKKLFKIPIDNSWIEDYKRMGVNLTQVTYESNYWWDEKVKEYTRQYGSKFFSHIDTSHPNHLKKLGMKSPLIYYLNITKYIYNNHKGLLFYIVYYIDKIIIHCSKFRNFYYHI